MAQPRIRALFGVFFIMSVYTLHSTFFAHPELLLSRNVDSFHRQLREHVSLPQLKNPCFVDLLDKSVTDEEYYKNHALIDPIAKKYRTHYDVHRASLYVRNVHDANGHNVRETQTRDSHDHKADVRNAQVHVRDGHVNDGYVHDAQVVHAQLRCLPYYYVLGVAKCGSTDLYIRLTCHPHVLKAVRKEASWFNAYRFDNASLSDYMDFFDPAAVEISRRIGSHGTADEALPHIVGDHSTNTFTMHKKHQPGYADKASGMKMPDSSAALLKQLNPDARLIIMLRDPTQRAYSHYRMHYALSPRHFHNGIVRAIHWFNDCVKREGYSEHCMFTGLPPSVSDERNEDEGYNAIMSVRHGVYHAYVKHWREYFPSQSFLYIKFEEYNINPYKYISTQVMPFLGLEQPQWYNYWTGMCMKCRAPTHVSSRLAKTGEADIDLDYSEPMLDVTATLLRDFYKPHNEQLARVLNDDKWLWQ